MSAKLPITREEYLALGEAEQAEWDIYLEQIECAAEGRDWFDYDPDEDIEYVSELDDDEDIFAKGEVDEAGVYVGVSNEERVCFSCCRSWPAKDFVGEEVKYPSEGRNRKWFLCDSCLDERGNVDR
jgi:hypothetical protein